jgi:hypothetical protein
VLLGAELNAQFERLLASGGAEHAALVAQAV